MWNGIGHGGDFLLSRAKEDGETQLPALHLQDRRVVDGHVMHDAVLYSVCGDCLDFRLVQARIRVLVREGGGDLVRLLPEPEVRGHVEAVGGKRGVAVYAGQVVPNVGLFVKVIADRGAGPVPRAPEEGFVLRF